MNTAVESDDGSVALRTRALAAMRGWRAAIAELVQEGIKRGEVQAKASPEAVATIIVSCLEGALMMSRLERDGGALHRVQNHLFDYLEASVRK